LKCGTTTSIAITAAVREGVPEAETGDDEPDLFLRRHGEDCADGERQQPPFVEVPDGEEQEGAGERDGMKLVQRQPLGRRVKQVREREPEGGSLRGEVLAGEPVDRKRAERNGDCLGDEQRVGARPEQPERRKGREDGIEVRGEARDLVAAQPRDL
jgi:hypothetical protein